MKMVPDVLCLVLVMILDAIKQGFMTYLTSALLRMPHIVTFSVLKVMLL